MVVNDGDFVLIEYTARVKETGNVVDTTDPEIAKKHGIYEEGQVYGPMLVVVGRKWVVEGLEEALKGIEPGEEKDIEVPPEKGYGVRDPSKVRVINIREFRRRGLTPRPGEVVEIGGNRGIVRAVTGSRVIVDFNHPLAGKTLVFHVRIVKKLEDMREKLEALAARYFSVPIGGVPVEYREEERSVVVYIPTRIMTRSDIQYSKIAYATTVYELFRDKVDRVVFIEAIEFRKPGTGEEKEEAEEKQSGEEPATVEEKETMDEAAGPGEEKSSQA